MEGTRSEASEGRERLEAGREARAAFLRCKKGKAPQELREPYCQAGQSWGKRVYISASPTDCHFQPICSHCYRAARSRQCCLMACGKQEARKEPQPHARVSKGRKCEWQLHCWHLPWEKKNKKGSPSYLCHIDVLQAHQHHSGLHCNSAEPQLLRSFFAGKHPSAGISHQQQNKPLILQKKSPYTDRSAK